MVPRRTIWYSRSQQTCRSISSRRSRGWSKCSPHFLRAGTDDHSQPKGSDMRFSYFGRVAIAIAILAVGGCGRFFASRGIPDALPSPPGPDPRIGLRAGLMDAGEALWNLRLVSTTPPPRDFIGVMNSDIAFTGNYAIQGNFNGYQVWDISTPSSPTLVSAYVCPASQSDVSVYKNLLFVSGEDLRARLDCGRQGVEGAVSRDRLRGIRIFDITDIRNPKNVGNVQTCRGSHTHTVLVDPRDTEDRKSTRLNSSHGYISYAVFCLKKKNK